MRIYLDVMFALWHRAQYGKAVYVYIGTKVRCRHIGSIRNPISCPLLFALTRSSLSECQSCSASGDTLAPSAYQTFLVAHYFADVPLVEAEMSRFASRITSVERKHGVTNGVEWHHGNGHNFVVTCVSRA